MKKFSHSSKAPFGRTAWRLESSLREFPNIIPVDFWFDYPIHTLAKSEELTEVPAKGSVDAKRYSGGKNLSRDQRADSIRMAYTACSLDPDTPVTIADIANYLGISDRAVRDRVKELPDEFCKFEFMKARQFQYALIALLYIATCTFCENHCFFLRSERCAGRHP